MVTLVQLTGLPSRPLRQPVSAGCTRWLCGWRLGLVTKSALEALYERCAIQIDTFTFYLYRQKISNFWYIVIFRDIFDNICDIFYRFFATLHDWKERLQMQRVNGVVILLESQYKLPRDIFLLSKWSILPSSMFMSCSYACIRFTYFLFKILISISISRYFVKYCIDIVLKLTSWYRVIAISYVCQCYCPSQCFQS